MDHFKERNDDTKWYLHLPIPLSLSEHPFPVHIVSLSHPPLTSTAASPFLSSCSRHINISLSRYVNVAFWYYHPFSQRMDKKIRRHFFSQMEKDMTKDKGHARKECGDTSPYIWHDGRNRTRPERRESISYKEEKGEAQMHHLADDHERYNDCDRRTWQEEGGGDERMLSFPSTWQGAAPLLLQLVSPYSVISSFTILWMYFLSPYFLLL